MVKLELYFLTIIGNEAVSESVTNRSGDHIDLWNEDQIWFWGIK